MISTRELGAELASLNLAISGEARLFITPELFRFALRRSERTRRVTKLEARLVVASPAPAVGVPVKRGAEDAEAPPAKKHAAD